MIWKLSAVQKDNVQTYNPIYLGEFSLSKDMSRRYYDKTQVPVIKTHVKLPIDLNPGFEYWQDQFEISNLDSLLTWICKNKFSLDNVQLITYRGLLKKVALTECDPYRNHWCMRLCKVGSTVLMDEVETEQKRKSKLSETHQQKKFIFYGHKFEESILDMDTAQAHNENNIVVTSKVGKSRCIFAAEIDGKFNEGEIVELKTHRVMHNAHHFASFQRNKLMNTYMQCFLAGIPYAYFGFRNNQGFVRELKKYEVSTIESMCRDHWNKNDMLTVLSSIIDWVIPLIENDKVYHMMYLGSDHVSLETVESGEYVPQWFTDYVKNYCDNDDEKPA